MFEHAIRPMVEADFEPVHRSLSNWWDDWGDTRAAEQRQLLLPRLFFQHFADTSAVMSGANDEIAAYLVGFLSQSRAGEAYIHFVGVHPNFRGCGMGRKLYQHFFTQSIQRGMTSVSCLTSPQNKTSIEFHRAMGFRILPGLRREGVEVQPDYDGAGLDRVCFVRDL